MSASKRPLNSPEIHQPLVKKIISFITSTPVSSVRSEKNQSSSAAAFETFSTTEMNSSLDQEMAEANPIDFVSIEV